ncbi:hypothetical protein ABBQ38_007655 [Trebouxia sp. C0009 RCD-2024]
MQSTLAVTGPHALPTCLPAPTRASPVLRKHPLRKHGNRRSRSLPRHAFTDQPAQVDMEDPKVQAQLQAMQEQMQRPEVQEQMKEAQALMQDKGFAEKVEKLKEDPELKQYFEQARSGDPQALMKLMSDPDLTKKVMSKLGQVPQSSQAPPGPPAGSQEAPEINNLWDAARYGDLEATEDFIAIGKDVNAADPDGRTPLHYAVAYDQQDVMRALIDASANLESEDNKQNTPLHYACGYGRGGCVETLIDAGANTGATNSSGKNGLDLVKLSDKNPINADDELLELLS